MRKTLGLFGLGIMLLALVLTFTSAVTLTPQDNSTTFTVTSGVGLANFTSTVSNVVLEDSDGDQVTLTISTSADTTNVTSVLYNVQASGSLNLFDFVDSSSESRNFLIVNTADQNTNETKSVEFTFENNNFCGYKENQGRLIASIEDIKVKEGFGDDDNYWYLLDQIEVEVNVENDGPWDSKDVEVSWELYTTAGRKILSDEVDTFDLRDGDDKTITFTFNLDENLDRFDGEEAILYVKAVGEVDDSDSAYDGEDSCANANEKEVEVRSDEEFVIAADFKINGENVDDVVTLECGDTLEVASTVFNIGDRDQDDVRVEIYSKVLGIDETFEYDEIKGFENEFISFNFEVPRDMEEKSYSLEFKVYNEDNDLFENDENDESVTSIGFKGAEKCTVEVPSVSAELIGDAKAGKGIVVRANFRNNDPEQRVFVIDAEGYESWATIESISPEFVELAPGENANVEFILEIKRDIPADDYAFNILASSEGEGILVQAVAMNVEDRAFGLNLFEGKDIDWKLWGIIALNVLLIVAIIIVTTKILRKK